MREETLHPRLAFRELRASAPEADALLSDWPLDLIARPIALVNANAFDFALLTEAGRCAL